jgi:hypothetical protein
LQEVTRFGVHLLMQAGQPTTTSTPRCPGRPDPVDLHASARATGAAYSRAESAFGLPDYEMTQSSQRSSQPSSLD